MSLNKLASLTERFNHWRLTRGKSRLTPPELIKLAVDLIGDYPRSEIVKALGINSSMLSRWESQYLSTPQFVELPTTDASLTQADTLQIEITLGAVHLKASGAVAELASFIAKLSQEQCR